jgi:hypothetical protein
MIKVGYKVKYDKYLEIDGVYILSSPFSFCYGQDFKVYP